MRKRIIFGLAGILVLAASCMREPQEPVLIGDDLALTAATEKPVASRSVVESGTQVFWEPGDEIAVFSGEHMGRFVSNLKEPSYRAVFWGTLGEDAWTEGLDLWGLYPYSEDATFDGETITTVLPSEQHARAESFGKDMNLSIARSTTASLQFYNVGGGVRFSVTEEGIKKVMFEGLNGEIISGKVRIGFDDEDLPTVLEVTEGSQFITLLPPSGQETFRKDTWYYIVAIPGTLEKGYKLRFYKDEDYARRVSEAAVTIKRSIYGSIEKADEGIDYEATTTHFPETEEDWEETERRINTVGKQVQEIVNNALGEDKNQVIEQIECVDGVLHAFLEDDGTVSILQTDSLWIYYFPNDTRAELVGLEIDDSDDYPAQTQSVYRSLPANKKTKESVNTNNQALILTPYFGYASDKIKEYLMNCGFQEDNIHIKKDTAADILSFKGDYLQQYKYVFIDTHGGTVYNTDPLSTTVVSRQTNFLSGTPFSSQKALHYSVVTKQLTKSQICVGYQDAGDYRFCMNVSFISNTDFSSNNPFFFLGACHSAAIENNLDGGSMVGTLLNNHAGAIAGYSRSIASCVNSFYAKYVLLFMSNGISFQNASKYWKENEIFEEFCTSSRYYLSHPEVWEEEDKEELSKLSAATREGNHLDKGLYRYYPLHPDNEYYLVNPIPVLTSVSTAIMGQPIQLSWDCDLQSFDLPIRYYQYRDGQRILFNKTLQYKAKYEVYLDGARLGKTLYTDDSDKTASWMPSSIGTHTWYVVGKIMEGDIVLASYQSEESDFTVLAEQQYETPDAKDLGLSVKWGSFNLGATKPEMPGYFFAWGETEPYYLRLVPAVWREGKEAGYDWASYKWCNGSSGSISKYNTNAMTQLELADDAVHAHLGDKWRIPTEDEWKELRLNCTFTWTNQDGVNGFLVTSNKPGYTNTHIFLPANGLVEKTSWSGAGESGLYWSSCNSTSEKEKAGGVTFESGSSDLTHIWIDRCYGIGIRPVYGDQMPPTTGDIEGTEEDPWN